MATSRVVEYDALVLSSLIRAATHKLLLTMGFCTWLMSLFALGADNAWADDASQEGDASEDAPEEDAALPSKLACVEASSRGQEERDAGRLIASRDEFRICAASSCPDVVRQACADWLAEVEGRLPAITLVVAYSDGTDVEVDQVLIDDAPVPELREGRLVTLDPGRHEVTVVAGQKRKTVVFVLRERETTRRIQVNLPAEPLALDQAAPRTFPWAPVLSVAGAGFMGASAGLGLWVKSDRDRCRPACSDEEVSSLRGRLVTAEVLLGASVVSLGTAAVLFLTKPSRSKETAVPGLRFSPTISPTAAFALLGGIF